MWRHRQVCGSWRRGEGRNDHGSEREEWLMVKSGHHMKLAEGRYIVCR